MNQPYFCFPTPPKYLVDLLSGPLQESMNEEHHGQVGNDEIVAQDDVQVQIMSIILLFRGDNSRRIS